MYLKKFVLKIVRVVTSTTIKFEDSDFDNNLINEKSYKNISTCDISCKTLTGPKLLPIRLNLIDRFIKIYDGTTISDKILWEF